MKSEYSEYKSQKKKKKKSFEIPWPRAIQCPPNQNFKKKCRTLMYIVQCTYIKIDKDHNISLVANLLDFFNAP